MRFELTNNDFADRALRPLGYLDINLVGVLGIEPRLSSSKPDVISHYTIPQHKYNMNSYYNQLLIDIPPLRNEVDVRQIKNPRVLMELDDVNPDMREFLLSLGITVKCIDLLYRTPGNMSTIHADNLSGDFTKINWIYGGKGSKMYWFTVNNPSPDEDTDTTGVNTAYTTYSINEVTCIESASLEGPYLLQVGIPHLVVNPYEDRHCLCFILADLNGDRLTMKQAQELLRDYIKPI